MEWGNAVKWFFFGLMCGFGISIIGVITLACFQAAKDPQPGGPYTMGVDPAAGRDATIRTWWCDQCEFKFPINQLLTLPSGSKVCPDCAKKLNSIPHFREDMR